MEIRTDQEAKVAIEQLCDIALKQGGLQNMNGVGKVLASIKLIKEQIPQKESENPDAGTKKQRARGKNLKK